MLVVSVGQRRSHEPQCGLTSSEPVLLSYNEVEQSEAVLLWCLVETYEGLLDTFEEVLCVLQKLEELVLPEGGLERQSTESGSLSDDIEEICLVIVLLCEDLEVLLLVFYPVLTLALAQFEQLLSLALEIDLRLLVSYDLGEVSMSRASIEFFDFDSEDGCRSSNGIGREGGEESSELAAGIV